MQPQSQLQRSDRGVSTVIAMILILGATVVALGAIGAFVFMSDGSPQESVPGDVGEDVEASASIECVAGDGLDGYIEITFQSNENADDGLMISMEVLNGVMSLGSDTLASVGDSTRAMETSSSPGKAKITVEAVSGDRSAVIDEKTCEI